MSITTPGQLAHATAAETVADRSSKINSKLQSRRDHIDELNAVRMLLIKLQVLDFSMPTSAPEAWVWHRHLP